MQEIKYTLEDIKPTKIVNKVTPKEGVYRLMWLYFFGWTKPATEEEDKDFNTRYEEFYKLWIEPSLPAFLNKKGLMSYKGYVMASAILARVAKK